MEECRLFRKDREGRRGCITLSVSDHLEFVGLHLGVDEELAETSWVRFKGRAGAGGITGVVCYRESLLQAVWPGRLSRCRPLWTERRASRSQGLVRNHPNICWRDKAAITQQPLITQWNQETSKKVDFYHLFFITHKTFCTFKSSFPRSKGGKK